MPANSPDDGPATLDEPDDDRDPATLQTPGLDAEVTGTPDRDTADGLPPGVDDDLRRALANAGVSPLLTTVLTPRSAPTGHGTLAVTPHADQRAVLLVQDEAGVVSWHRPHAPTDGAEDAGSPPPGERVEFRIPAHRLAPADAAAPLGSALAGPAVAAAAGTGAPKLLQVLEFPVGSDAVGAAASAYAKWEQLARPAAVRWFPPRAGLPRGGVLTDAAWRSLHEQHVLLFVHGIFSSCISGFAQLLADAPALDELWQELRTEYDGRILGYDHPTVSVSIEDNVTRLLEMIPEDVHLTLDIVCHSRGGLVARQLVNAARAERRAVAVNKIVFVGTPNGGTAIVEPDHWSALVDRWTNLLRFLPPGPWRVTATPFEEIVELVKVMAQQGEADLPGLDAMTPGSPLYAELDGAPADPPTYYAIQADYEPHGALLNLFDLGHDLGELVDPLVDEVFGAAPNDVAVPTVGVGDPSAVEDTRRHIPGFPVPDERRLDFGRGEVWHCSYFGEPRTWEHLRHWLRDVDRPAMPAPRVPGAPGRQP